MSNGIFYYEEAKKRFGETQTAVLRTYQCNGGQMDQLCEISAEHDFSKGPYQDTVGFSVGSNQAIFSQDEV